jgi:hypothetical protein
MGAATRVDCRNAPGQLVDTGQRATRAADEIAQTPVFRGPGGNGRAKEEGGGMKEEELKQGNAGQIPCESQSKTTANHRRAEERPRDNLA